MASFKWLSRLRYCLYVCAIFNLNQNITIIVLGRDDTDTRSLTIGAGSIEQRALARRLASRPIEIDKGLDTTYAD